MINLLNETDKNLTELLPPYLRKIIMLLTG